MQTISAPCSRPHSRQRLRSRPLPRVGSRPALEGSPFVAGGPLLRSVMDSALDAIVISDDRGRIQSWNRAAQAIFGYAEAEVLGRPLTCIVPERFRQRHRAGLERALREGHGPVVGRAANVVGLTRDGREVPIELSLSSWVWEQRTYFTAILRDVSERVAAEAREREQARAIERRYVEALEAQSRLVAQEAQAAVGRLAAGMLHEMNSPLGALRSASDTAVRMLRYCADVERRRFAAEASPPSSRGRRVFGSVDSLCETLEAGTARIAQVVERLGRLAPPEADLPRALDVSALVDDALGAFAASIPSGVRVQRRIQSGGVRVACRPSSLAQTLVSLIENSVSALGQAGTLSLEVGVVGSDVCIAVVDDGPGLNPEQIEEAFRIGFVERAGRVRMRLGLASCRRAIEREGGSLSLESEPGRGTRATIRLPAADVSWSAGGAASVEGG